jgi:ectoine hydroxylase-related dioxygenase (phytanoyl-CoA dioxygenase family)
MLERTINTPLVSNGYTLKMTADRLEWLTPSDPAASIESLREQFRAQGYLWLKRLLNRDAILNFRGRFFEAFHETGLLAKGTDVADGIFSGGKVDSQGTSRILSEAHRWAAYESFCLAEPIWKFYEAFLGGAVYIHGRKLIRYTTAAQKNMTGAHYDLTYLRAGTERVYTSWIPIGDIPVEMGGLIYLQGSDKFGREQEAEFTRKNADLSPEERISAYNKNMTETGWLTKDLPSLAERLNTRWLLADYEAGDMVVHSAYMIHAATTNISAENRMRLSTDIRYQLVNDKIDERWSKPWSSEDNL